MVHIQRMNQMMIDNIKELQRRVSFHPNFHKKPYCGAVEEQRGADSSFGDPKGKLGSNGGKLGSDGAYTENERDDDRQHKATVSP
ncbi:hypothetical protein YC2023_093994 [Brassica napus]